MMMRRLTGLSAGTAIVGISSAGVLLASLAAAPDPAAEEFWPQWRGPYATGVSKTADPPVDVERDEEHPLEGRDPRPRLLVACRLGRSAVPADRRAGGPLGARRRTSRAAASSRATFTSSSSWPSTATPAKTLWERTAREARPHEGVASGQRHLGVELGDHRRASASTRISSREGLYAYDMDGTLLWQKDLGDKTDAQRVRRGQHAGPVTAIASSSSGITRGHRSSPRSTRPPASESGAASARRSTPGRRRWWSSTTAARRSSRAA